MRRILGSQLGIALAIITHVLLAADTIHALTRTWDRGSGIGGLYSSDSHWLPAGVPRPEDDVLFNDSSATQIEIVFIQDHTATDLFIDDGDIKFVGSGTRNYNLNSVRIDESAELSLGNAFANAPNRFLLNVANNVEVTGDLTLLDGARVTAELVNLDSTSFSTPAELTLSGQNASGDPSLLDIAELSIGDNRRGNVRVEGGAAALIGNLEMERGEIVVTGVGSNGASSSITLEQDVSFGFLGNGGVQVLQGAVFDTQAVSLGNNTPILVDGKSVLGVRSRWNVAGTLSATTSDIVISGGAEFISGSTTMISGDIQVTGLGTTWTTSGLFEFKLGSLEITGGASVSSENAHLGRTGNGSALVTGGTIPSAVTIWANTGNVSVGGDSAAGDNGIGLLDLSGMARVEIGGTLKVFDLGTINVGSSSSLVVNRIENTSGGAFNFLGGSLQTVQFVGNLTNQGGALTPGGEAAGFMNIEGDYNQAAGSVLALDVGGTNPGGTHDFVTVIGEAQIDGLLELSLIDGFIPDATDELAIFSTTDGLFGSFDNIASGQRLETIDGTGSFLVSYGSGSAFNENRIVLSNFQQILRSDFNFDAAVDGDDFLIWQRNSSVGSLSDWQTNYGTQAAALKIATTVPEPRTVILLAAIPYFLSLWRCGRLQPLPTGKKMS